MSDVCDEIAAREIVSILVDRGLGRLLAALIEISGDTEERMRKRLGISGWEACRRKKLSIAGQAALILNISTMEAERLIREAQKTVEQCNARRHLTGRPNAAAAFPPIDISTPNGSPNSSGIAG